MACLIPDKGTGASKGAVVGIFLYLTFFGFTWLELPWLYPAEINPLKTRTVANAVSTINNWLWNVSSFFHCSSVLKRFADVALRPPGSVHRRHVHAALPRLDRRRHFRCASLSPLT